MIKIINLTKSFGKQILFDNITVSINRGERVGLVGRNGHGKTTLFRIIIGEELPDSGEVAIPRNYRIGYVTQQLIFTEETVLDETCRGLPEHLHTETWMAEKVLSGLGFSKQDMKRPPLDFSGGFQVRLNLARTLVSEPDLLLLDEPTNYLDIVSIRWLEKYIRQWKSEIIIITHDRSFMDSVTTHTMGIHRKKIRKIEGSTEKYYSQILKEEEIFEKTRINDEKKRKETELFIARFRAKARLAGMVQSRIKSLQKQDKLDRLEKIKTLEFSFSYKPFPAKVLMSVENLSFSFGKEDLIRDLSITIGREDRICVIGKNGKGKTTLLRLLAGELVPHKGVINAHGEMKIGHFAQTNISHLIDSFTIEEEIMSNGSDRQRARDIAGAMMFEGDMGLKKISVLSGGEKSRVLLGKIISQQSNLLLLDEPTNHLDMESSDALLAAIDDFEGAAVIVTHNEMFLHSLASRFVVFQDCGVSVFEGTYQNFLDNVGWEDERDAPIVGMPFIQATDFKENVSKKDLRKVRADILSRKSKTINPLKAKIAHIESSIQTKEKQLSGMNNEIIAASSAGKSETISRLSKEIHKTRTDIDSLFDELESLISELEMKSLQFEQELVNISIDASKGCSY
ncbi:MAG: ABC transporter ATP-binding protein [Spirochaetes bacterium RBG_13_51_14]|nr:MAG: ABC transporter ATP-binding protein [Spirochaetes bacterium RBG_13_51_14]